MIPFYHFLSISHRSFGRGQLFTIKVNANEFSHLENIKSHKDEYSLYRVLMASGTFKYSVSPRFESQYAFIAGRLGKTYFSPYRQISDVLHSGIFRQDQYHRQLIKDFDNLNELHQMLTSAAGKSQSYDFISIAASSSNIGTSICFDASELLEEELKRSSNYAPTIYVDGSIPF